MLPEHRPQSALASLLFFVSHSLARDCYSLDTLHPRVSPHVAFSAFWCKLWPFDPSQALLCSLFSAKHHTICRFLPPSLSSRVFFASVKPAMVSEKQQKPKAPAFPKKMTQTKLTSKRKETIATKDATPEAIAKKVKVQGKSSGSEKVEAPGQVIAAANFPMVPVSKEVHPARIRVLKEAKSGQTGPVLYWVSRDQRSRDNWALLYAVEQARQRGASVAVIFNLVDNFLGAQARHFGFLLRGLRVMEKNLKAKGIPFFLFQGKPEETIPAFALRTKASLLVVDYSPLRIGCVWRQDVCNSLAAGVSMHEVDAHNIVPVWTASPKLEVGARTIRGKIQKLLPEFLVEYPVLENVGTPWLGETPRIDWNLLIEQVLRVGAEVPEVDWCEAGEDAALESLVGENGFLKSRLRQYEDDRNDPSKTGGLSGLSPYLHYGHVSSQRCALEAQKVRRLHTKAADAFLEELVIRRELADNFCHYQPEYDNLKGASNWARATLADHASDKRDHIYTLEELEKGKTYDQLWNASQLEMVHYGKMHGFMRMYWAKKILEWTPSPEEALSTAIYLNDKYELDGRDPNGYVGCMWSICGIHDQGWKERPIFGKVRYMNYAGCKRKFNVDKYIMYVNQLVAELKRNRKASKLGCQIP